MGDSWGGNSSYGYSSDNRGGNYGGYERRNYGGGGGGGNRDHQGGGGGGGSRYYNRSYDGGNQGGFRSRPSFNNMDDGDATIMKVPTRFVGRIIGRGGSKINDLQYKSGARIQVTKDTEGDDTLVKLFGNSGAVSKAQDLIGDLTVDY